MKKPNKQTYEAYNRNVNGESVGEIAFELNVSETTVHNMINRVKEFEKWDSVPKITELGIIMHPKGIIAQRKFNKQRNGGVEDYLYDAVLHVYSCRVYELFLLQIFGYGKDEFQQESENGYDVELNLQNWQQGKSLTKYPPKIIDAVNDMTILHLNDAGHIIDVYDAVQNCEYRKNILQINLTVKLKESFKKKLPDLKIQII